MLETLRCCEDASSKQVFETSKLKQVRTFLLSRLYGNNNTIEQSANDADDITSGITGDVTHDVIGEANGEVDSGISDSSTSSSLGDEAEQKEPESPSLADDMQLSGVTDVSSASCEAATAVNSSECLEDDNPESPASTGSSPTARDTTIRKVNLHRSLHRSTDVPSPSPANNEITLTLAKQLGLKQHPASLNPVSLGSKSEAINDLFKVRKCIMLCANKILHSVVVRIGQFERCIEINNTSFMVWHTVIFNLTSCLYLFVTHGYVSV